MLIKVIQVLNVKNLNFFNPELQLKDIQFVIRNKLIDILTELK